jgi:hypothetical protein
MALSPVWTGWETLLRKITLQGGLRLGVHRALAVDGIAQRVDDAAQKLGTHRHFENAAGGLDDGTFGDVLVIAEHHGAHRILLEVQGQPEGIADEFQHFAVTCVGEPVDAHDAVGDAHHRADIARLGGSLEFFDARLDEVADFRCLDGHIDPLAAGCLPATFSVLTC